MFRRYTVLLQRVAELVEVIANSRAVECLCALGVDTGRLAENDVGIAIEEGLDPGVRWTCAAHLLNSIEYTLFVKGSSNIGEVLHPVGQHGFGDMIE